MTVLEELLHRRQADVFFDVSHRNDAKTSPILGEHDNAAFYAVLNALNIRRLAANLYGPLRMLIETKERPDRLRPARADETGKPDNLAFSDVEGNVVKPAGPAVML